MKDDDERFWNLIIFKMYATDQEMAKMAPYIIGMTILIAIGIGVVYYLNN